MKNTSQTLCQRSTAVDTGF